MDQGVSQKDSEPIRVMIVDDHGSFRQALAFILGRRPGFVVSAEAATLAEARRSAEEIDAAIVDLALPDGNGRELVEELRSADPEITILVLSATLAQQDLAEVIDAGASGVLDKLSGIEEICDAIHRLRAGEAILSHEEVKDMFRAAARQAAGREPSTEPDILDPGEKEMLQAMADGLDSAQAATKVGISPEEERSRMAKILEKLGAHTRLQAILIAARSGLIQIR